MKRIAILTLIFIQSICAIAQTPQRLCRKELSTFYAGIGGLGSAWGRAAHEPTVMNPGAIADMQAVIGNAKAALNLVKCVPYDVKKIDALIAKLPSLTNVKAVAEIEATIKEIQAAIAKVNHDCGTKLMSLYGLGIHIGAAQAHASSRMCLPAPMPANLQTVIFNHLKTAQDAFAVFLPCVPGFPLSSITSVNLNSAISVEPHINIIMIHCNILWNIALSDCCCECTGNQSGGDAVGGLIGQWSIKCCNDALGWILTITKQEGTTFSGMFSDEYGGGFVTNGQLRGNTIEFDRQESTSGGGKPGGGKQHWSAQLVNDGGSLRMVNGTWTGDYQDQFVGRNNWHAEKK